MEHPNPYHQPTQIAAVFATMNRTATAVECVRRLSNQTIQVGKLVVTDNASTDSTVEDLRDECQRGGLAFEIISSPENLGNAGGIKLAIERAFLGGAEAVWILDDDSWPEPDAFEAILDPDGPQDGIRTSMVLAPDSDRLSWPCEVSHPHGHWCFTVQAASHSGWVLVRRSWLGALIPRHAYAKVGPVNGDLFLRGEDEDYPRRLVQAGYQFWMGASSILRHPISGDLARFSFGGESVCIERNLDENRLYYRIRNMLWIKRNESGALVSIILSAGYLILIITQIRPFWRSLKVFGEAAKDGFANRLGRRGDPP